MEPRQQLLGIWKATALATWRGRKWAWGGRDGANSISDSEQLLCLLMPATQLGDRFGLDRPEQTNEDVLTALKPYGNHLDIPRRVADALREYFDRYSEDGRPVFAGGSYFRSGNGAPVTDEQRRFDIVDSYAMSVTLSLATIGFVRVFRTSVRTETLRDRLRELEVAASVRLSAAMVGLLRSFTINVFDAEGREGRTLVDTVNQGGLSRRIVVERLRTELRDTMASFREVLIGSGQVSDDGLEGPDQLFECGWTWGIAVGAPPIETTEKIGDQREGFAEDKPYLYFTVTALDAIEDLWSERTRILGLLNEEQQRLARALQLRYDLTGQYWATVATFGDGKWPIEDIPWRTTDGEQSDYFTLLVTSLAVKGFVKERSSDAGLTRVGRILRELASRAKVSRRPVDNDPAVTLHAPGVRLLLGTSVPPDGGSDAEIGSSDDEPGMDLSLSWVVSEFAPLLLQRTATIAGLLTSAEERGELLELADEVWDHLENRTIKDGPGRDLWDQPRNVFNEVEAVFDDPSWYFTQRVVQGLVLVGQTVYRPPQPSRQIADLARYRLLEAEHLFDQQLLNTPSTSRNRLSALRTKLARAREIMAATPATAETLVSEVLAKLDELTAAAQDVSKGS